MLLVVSCFTLKSQAIKVDSHKRIPNQINKLNINSNSETFNIDSYCNKLLGITIVKPTISVFNALSNGIGFIVSQLLLKIYL